MTAALAYLIFNSWKNRLLFRFRRLKQPKYLVGAVVGGLYMYFYFFRFMFYSRPGGRGGVWNITPEAAGIFESLGAALILVFVLWAWISKQDRTALVFTEAEVAFLFPAPVSRPTLVNFKLFKSQIPILWTSLIFTLVFGRASTGSPVWIRAVGWWVILSTLNLHLLGASFARTMLFERGVGAGRRRVAVLGVVALAVAIVGAWAYAAIPPPNPDTFDGFEQIRYYFERLLNSGPLPYLLLPFRFVARPYLALDAGQFLKAIGPALLVLGLHYVWVVRSDVAFEEASVDASRKAAEALANIRANRGRYPLRAAKKRKDPFRLGPVGWPALGFLWKNLIGARQLLSARLLVILAIPAVAVATSFAGNSRVTLISTIIGYVALWLLGMSVLIGPQFARSDFRSDLGMADMLKSYPMKGWQVALGELLAPALILSGAQWVMILVAAAFISKASRDIPVALRCSLAAGAALVVAPLNIVSLMIPNAAVLYFPSWFYAGKNAPQGIEATGQRMIFALGQFLVFAIALAPASLAFLAVFFVARLALPVEFVIPLAALAAAAVLAAEGAAGVAWLGRLFEKLDISSESSPD